MIKGVQGMKPFYIRQSISSVIINVNQKKGNYL